MIDYIYRVRETDTLESIADAFSITPSELIACNNITQIREGDRLIIMKKPQLTHMVMPNETLSDIAGRYLVSEAELKENNDIGYLYTGLNLIIKR